MKLKIFEAENTSADEINTFLEGKNIIGTDYVGYSDHRDTKYIIVFYE
jgi:hypothetical protein